MCTFWMSAAIFSLKQVRAHALSAAERVDDEARIH